MSYPYRVSGGCDRSLAHRNFMDSVATLPPPSASARPSSGGESSFAAAIVAISGGDRDGSMVMRRSWQRYALACVFVGIATAARYALDPILGKHIPYPTYFLATIVTGWACGLGPSIVCLAFSVLTADFFFVPPRGSFLVLTAPDLLGLGLFVLVNIPILILLESFRATRREAEKRAETLARVEGELRRDKRVLWSVLNSMAEGVIVCDRAGNRILANAVSERLAGKLENSSTSAPAKIRSAATWLRRPC